MIVAAVDSSSHGGMEIVQITGLVTTLLERYPAVALLIAVEQGTPKPNFEERQQIQDALDHFRGHLVVGYAFCGLGFWASTVQAIVIGISRLTRAPVIVHDSVEAAAQHIAREHVGTDADVMAQLCEQLRAELREAGRTSSMA